MRYLCLAAAMSVVFLSGCGNSDNDEHPVVSPPVNKAPVISLASSFSGNEKTELSINATASDSDGSIASYAWVLTSGPSVELNNPNTNTVSLTLPEVMSDSELVLTLSATDDDGAIASQDVTVIINQLTIPLTLTGKVTDSPIANATIKVLVSDMAEPIEASADTNGDYSIDLLLDDSQANAFVRIEAVGSDTQANASLMSLLGSVTKLVQLAGDDNTLTADEYFALQVTHYTTAQYGLIMQNTDTEIASDDALQSALRDLDYNQVLWLAGAIKVAIDKSTDNTALVLPEGVMTTLAMATNQTIAAFYLAQIIDSPDFTDALEEIFSDPLIADTASAWDLPERYYFMPEEGIASNTVVDFYSDNTGKYGKSPFTWQLNEGVLSVTMDPTTLSYTNPYVTIDEQRVRVQRISGVESYSIKRIGNAQDADILLITATNISLYPFGELPNEQSQHHVMQLAYQGNPFVAINFTAPTQAFLAIEPDVNVNDTYIIADTFTLNPDGTGSSLLGQAGFDWQLIDGALIFENISNRSSGKSLRFRQIASAGVFDYFLYEELENGDVSLAIMGKGLITTQIPQWQMQDIPGLYSILNGTAGNPQLKVWFELHENGDAEYYFHSNQNGQGYTTQKQYGVWHLEPDGNLRMQLGLDAQSYSSTAACRFYLSAGCTRGEGFSFNLAGQQDNVLAVINKQDFGDDGFYFTETLVLNKISDHLIPIDNLENSDALTFKEIYVADQVFSLFDEDGEYGYAIRFYADHTAEILGNSTGTWLIDNNGKLVVDMSGNKSIFTSLSFDESLGQYQVSRLFEQNASEIMLQISARPLIDFMFTPNELNNVDFFVVWENDEGCTPAWITEAIMFGDDGNYVLDLCYSNTDEHGSYSITETGNIVIHYDDDGRESIKKVGFDAKRNGWLVCWDNAPGTLEYCSVSDTGYLFAESQDAQTYAESKNQP